MYDIDFLMELYRAPYQAQDRIRNHLEQRSELQIDLMVGRKVLPYYKPLSDFQLAFWSFVDRKGQVIGERLILSINELWRWDDNFEPMWIAEAGRKPEIEILGITRTQVPHPHAPL